MNAACGSYDQRTSLFFAPRPGTFTIRFKNTGGAGTHLPVPVPGTGKKTRGAVGSGPAAVESAAASVVALTCGVCVVGTGFGWVTGGFLYKLGGGSYTIRILMYPACILHVSCMYSSRYIKIHRDTTRYICICHFGHQRKCILPRDMYPSLRYIQDTFKIHCILTLRYMTHKIHSP